MGSAAFLNEAINQLSEDYLLRKQREIGRIIPHQDYAQEKQKVKMFIADNNVFGVDLNPVAVELAEVSLWLNTIYEGAFVPWFGMQLVCGNSLVGARRQVFSSKLLRTVSRSQSCWLDSVPDRIMPGTQRHPHTVYHFLLPDKGMADYKDKVVRQLAESSIEKIKEWKKHFLKAFSKGETDQLERLSEAVDRLWEKHTDQLRKIRQRTADPLDVFGQPEKQNGKKPSTTQHKDRILFQEILSKDVRNSSPYRRLKLVMDYWCALWFWPIENAHLLPTREEYMLDLSLILEGNVLDTGDGQSDLPLFPDTQPREEALKLVDEHGFVNVDKLCREVPRLAVVQALADRYHFLHWELEFSGILTDRGGFDLVLGNPPWIRIEWEEGGVLGDANPLFVLRKLGASNLAELRERVTMGPGMKDSYLSAYQDAEGTQNFLTGYQSYPMLKGLQTNLFKCFLPLGWYLSTGNGIVAFVTDEGVFNDPKAGTLREFCYRRLRRWFHFSNERILFKTVGHAKKFELAVYGGARIEIEFDMVSNVYHPITIDNSYSHSGVGPVPGMKDNNNQWNLDGHSDRIIKVTGKLLGTLVKLYDAPDTPSCQGRLPVVHARQIINVLHAFACQAQRLISLQGHYISMRMWDETNARKDGTILRKTHFPASLDGLVLSGPHFYVGLPLYKTPRSVCTEKGHYDCLDLTELPPDYVPRTNWVAACDKTEYMRRVPRVPWGNKGPVTEYFRFIYRAMLPPSNERTLIGAIFPPGVAHTNGCHGYAFKPEHQGDALSFAALTFSIPFDFFTKATGRTNLHNMLDGYPLAGDSFLDELLVLRALMLNCLTVHYADFWRQNWKEVFKKDHWAGSNPRLDENKFSGLAPEWRWDCPLRSDFERRQALVEVDVLSAMVLGIQLNELKTIYRVQFPVLRQYEQDTWYDLNGRIVFTASKGLSGVGMPRAEWENVKKMRSGTLKRIVIDDTMPGGPKERTIVYEAPFDRCDREKDYEVAWAEFERRLGKNKAVAV